MKDVSKEVVAEWFETFEKAMKEYDIAVENRYNMDESGFSIGVME